MSDENPHLLRLRIPRDLMALVEAASAANRRSMNAEIVARLAGSFDHTAERLAKLEAVVFDDDYDGGIAGRVSYLEEEVESLKEAVERLRARERDRY
jgi:hypothetical protein